MKKFILSVCFIGGFIAVKGQGTEQKTVSEIGSSSVEVTSPATPGQVQHTAAAIGESTLVTPPSIDAGGAAAKKNSGSVLTALPAISIQPDKATGAPKE